MPSASYSRRAAQETLERETLKLPVDTNTAVFCYRRMEVDVRLRMMQPGPHCFWSGLEEEGQGLI